ncbi:ECF transporter S component [Paramaledivibacter caminithermalis]|jgi:hypothetical protein|uniref:Energy-coupling factor transport system substrate-specific component n=1 Tax=Paramaledivibacter caminithermalis (strain DSM 15212 / CIP 107654 / DViRD3) TaxID=1121301 RepID=A0A1M6K8V8_PARC5|nr:ECF transporter S component [Paramaledivibacter caminithermalis]SHJ55344.1 hypothetical protein SAMN02745912_00321 [Paramaledivibacter caminithermalis DSM 15212]
MLLKKFTLKDLIYISLLAAIATITKIPLKMASKLFASTFGLPGGIINGMYYMFWLIAAYGIVGKRGTGILFCIIQAGLSIYIFSMPSIKVITFIPPGLAVDLLNVIINCKKDTKVFMALGGAVANVAGTLTMSILVMKVPLIGLIMASMIASISGGIGGYCAYIVVKNLKIYQLQS